ncbi:Dynein axonemal heavy chain 7 [Anthophora plagiata]
MVNVHNLTTIASTFDYALVYNEMKMCLKHISFKEFPIDWEEDILKLLPKKYKKRYSSLIDTLLKEAKNIYAKDMQHFLCKVILTDPRESEDYSSAINNMNYKFLDEKQTNNYNIFLKHHKLLKRKYFLFLEPIKIIINSAQLKLPAVICNFKHYHQFGLMSLTDFQSIIDNDIKKGSLAITNHFYTKVSRTIAGSQILKNVNERKLSNIMQCITHVFVQQILNVMIKSVDHILNIMNDGHYCPQIKFQLFMQDNQLLLSPSIKEVYSMYHCMIEKIGAIAQDLIPLEEWLNIRSHFRYIKIKLPDWYIKESHNRLEVILCNLFQSINKHIANIAEEFYSICAPSLKERILSLTSGEINFDLYLQHVQEYNTYLMKVNAMIMNTYHVVGKLEQHAAKEALKKECYDIINVFLNKLIKYHQEYNLSICLEFEDIKTKALDVPKNAKDLIELIDYISYASQELITELECKIERSVHMLGILLEMTHLSEDHIQLNKNTINWLYKIEPVFKQSNILCEAMKNELEDDIQKRTNKLNLDVDNIIPQLNVLDNMDDISNIGEYVEYYKKLLKHVNQINHEMQRINEEESLFKFPETEFPNVIEVHEIIISFYDLIYIIYQWQKDNSVWLDGPFEWLDAVIIERKTLNYFKKITEISKAFRTKIKMDVIANKCFKFSGIADDPDPMQQPTPLKLCWQALNDINDFKKYLPLVICMCNPALQKRHWIEMSAIYVVLLPSNYTIFLETLETICKSRSVYMHDVFKLKIIQIFELMYIYQSLVLVGDPFVGKTEILNVLQLVLSSLYKKGIEFGVNVKLETIVPSTIDTDQLFGYLDVKSKVWKDGMYSKVFRSFLENDSSDKKWLVLDGPLNNTWIENMYTVLDTNKVLHLTSGEKLHMTNPISIIFETMNMENVSPAILSNCGIVYIESSSIDWRSYVKTHFSKNNIYNEYEEIYVLFIWAMDASLQFIEKHCTLTLAVGQLHCVISTLNLFEMYLTDVLTENTEEKGKMGHFLVWVQVVLILSVIWGLGGNLDTDSHIKFNSFCMSLWSGTNKEYPKPDVIKTVEVTLPHEGLIQDHFYVFKGVGNWKYWGGTDILKNEQILEIPDCNEILVPTIDTMKYNYILLKHIKHRKPFIICGDISVGKTSLIKNLLKNKLTKEMYFNMFSFISLTTVAATQQLLLSKLNKIRKRHYGASKHQFCINFIDDLNMQRYECKSKINSVLELFRQYLNYGYFYDINEPEKVFVHDIMFSFSVIVNAASEICPRFLRHFNLYTIYVPTADTIFRIFSNVLFSNLKKNLFTADVFSTVISITNATIDVYNSVIKILRPIPAKFQYQFNTRDISKVISGCSLLQKDSIETKVTFIRLWAHEIWRVFGDRMLDHSDKEWLFLQIKNISKCHFKDSFETVFDYLPKFDNNEITKDSFNNLMFSNFINAEQDGIKAYEEISSTEKLKNKILFYLNEYNNNNTKKHIDLIVSQYILECLIKISRILATPRGNLLMISNIGSGRKSLTILAAYMQRQELFEPSVYSYCDLNIWREDLKTVLKKCGGLGENCTLFLKDKQMKDHFFHDISSLLATGEIPNLFSIEERCDIIEMVRLNAQGGNKNEEISNHAVINYFLEQCKDKLHIIICCSITNKAIRSYLYKYPELVKYCTINWYEMWPTDTLTQIGIKYIENINVEEKIKMNVITVCIKLHNSMQEVSTKYYKQTGTKIHVTLSAFLHMLKLYTYLFSKKEKDIFTIRNKYLAGLEKLELAAQQVKKMKATLTMLKPQLELSAEKTINTMKEVENENISVEKATILVQQEEEIANKKAEIAGRLKMECEADLAVAIPILEDAVAALNTLKPTDITLVKAMKNPPDTVKLVMAAICVMLDVTPDKAIDSVTGKKYIDYWSPSKRILSDMNFLQILKDYDKDNIPSNIIQVIKKTYIIDSNFKPHIVAKASSAAEGLCKWVCAMVSYDEVAKAVAPKKEKLYIAQKECNEAEAFLNEKRKTLFALNAKLAVLNKSLQETLQQKVKLEQEVEDCTSKLHKAENLMTSLGGEKNHWIQFAENLKTNYNNLIGDVILTCGIISYIASYNIVFRDKILGQWKQYIEDVKILYSPNYDLVNVLGEENDMNYWYLSGLPKNRFSVENAIIMNNSKLWSLLIDSQNQANQWIKTIEKNNNLKVVKLTDLDYISVIQYNIENGIPTLIENVGEELGTLLDPFLLKRMCNNEEYSYLDTSCDIIKYSFDFRLYITTRLANPQFPCEVFNKLTIINFSIPNEALEDKLLDFIISKEKPELHEKFETLLIEDASNKKILKQQEEIILSILSSTTTNILEDESAVKSLDSSKSLSLNIIKKRELTKTKLILVKVLHPDKIIAQIMQMIKNVLGGIHSHSPKIKISQSYAESTCLTPILFILPACLSPLSLISTFAKSKGHLSKFVSLSMNKDQEKKAEHLIQRAQREGSWVFLENCHLTPHWMVQLERICENCNSSNVSSDFRLWLSCYSFKEFPISILQNSIKIIHDYPLSIREALLNIYQSEPITNKEFLDACPGKNNIFLKLLFGICLFHVVIKERRNFGIQGWNTPYDFDYTDLQISIMQLQTFINNTDHVPFDTLLYFFGECNYGGKIQDKFDGKCLKHLLNDYCNSNIIENHQCRHLNNIEMLIPQRCEYYHIVNHIEKIPSELSPEIFGSNKNGVFIRNTMMITEFLSLFSCMNSPIPMDKELHQDQVLILINDIDNKLRDSIQINEISDKCTSMLEEPLERVLFCEVKSLKQILTIITESLNNLKLALNGYHHLTNSLRELAKEIYENKIPHIWEKTQAITITGNLSYYIDNLLKRTNFVKNWMNHGCPKTISFDTLFHYKMFFSAILSTFSKKYNIPIEEIGFDFEIATEETIARENIDTYSICGLHLCGARWNFEANILTENFTTETWQKMPPIYLKYSQNKEKKEKAFDCPLYIAAVQHIHKDIKFFSKNYIITIPLKTDVPQSHWIKCGTALFCHVT